jgi:hypothetical protein
MHHDVSTRISLENHLAEGKQPKTKLLEEYNFLSFKAFQVIERLIQSPLIFSSSLFYQYVFLSQNHVCKRLLRKLFSGPIATC